jgi:hypothetical protein
MNLSEIQQLYAALAQAEAGVNNLTSQLADATTHYERLRRDLGDMLMGLGMQSVTMADGKTLGLKTEYYGSAAQDRMEAIRSYLDRMGMGNIAKPKKLALTPETLPLLPKSLRADVQYEIHHSTLKSFITDLAANGNLDQEARELFKVHQQNTVIVK